MPSFQAFTRGDTFPSAMRSRTRERVSGPIFLVPDGDARNQTFSSFSTIVFTAFPPPSLVERRRRI